MTYRQTGQHGVDLLLGHGFYLRDDERERELMKPYPPLGILYLSSYLRSEGFDVAVFDATFQSRADFQRQLRERQPRVVGLSANLLTRAPVLAMLEDCRNAGCLAVAGGPDPSAWVDEYLRAGFDFVVRGEGEETMAELLHALNRGREPREAAIAGLSYLDGRGRIVHQPARPRIDRLAAMPWPDRQAIDMDAYLRSWKEHHGYSSVSLICARGCPYRCTWCSHSVFGFSHRRRDPADVADELASIRDTYAPDRVWYADDVFTIHPKWLQRYAALLRQRSLHIPFECISRADRLDDESIDLLAEMGCRRLWIGSESGSQRILDAMQRGVLVEQVEWAIARLRQAGIASGLFIMLGYEGEEERDLRETAGFLKRVRPDLFLTTLAYPIKNTDYFHRVEDHISAERSWRQGTERDWRVLNRPSPVYYSFANRWLTHDVALARARRSGTLRTVDALRMAAHAWLGRVGMALTGRRRVPRR